MWWPKLETKINEILKSHVESSPNALRSEREILEEVLELTRINTKRIPRRGDISRGVIQRLVDTLMEMQYRLMKYAGPKESMIFYEEMRMSIKQLCLEIDEPELYERYMINSEKNMMFRKDKMFVESIGDKETDKK